MVVIEDSNMILKGLENKTNANTLPYPNKKRRVGFSHRNPLEVVVGSPKHKDLTESVSSSSSPALTQMPRKKSASLQNLTDVTNELQKQERLVRSNLKPQLSFKLESDNENDLTTWNSTPKLRHGRQRSGSLNKQHSIDRVKSIDSRSSVKARLRRQRNEESDEPDFHELDFGKSLQKSDSTREASNLDCANPWKQRADTMTSTSTKSYDSEGSGQSYISYTNNQHSTLDRRSLSSRRGSAKSACPQNFIPGENKGRKYVPALSFFRKTSVCFHGVNVKINQDAPRTFRAVAYVGILGLVIPSPSKHGCKLL